MLPGVSCQEASLPLLPGGCRPRLLLVGHQTLLDNLVSGAAGVGDDALELVDLSLGTAKGTEL